MKEESRLLPISFTEEHPWKVWVHLARSNGYVGIDDCHWEVGSRSHVLGDSREMRLAVHLRLTLENEKCRSLKEGGWATWERKSDTPGRHSSRSCMRVWLTLKMWFSLEKQLWNWSFYIWESHLSYEACYKTQTIGTVYESLRSLHFQATIIRKKVTLHRYVNITYFLNFESWVGDIQYLVNRSCNI